MAWITQEVIAPPDVVIATDDQLPAYPSVIVGDPPQWGDDSDATYADIWAQYGTGTVNKQNAARTEMGSFPDLWVDPAARVAVWYRWTTEGSGVRLRAEIYRSAASVRLRNTDGLSNGLTAPAGWDVVEMHPVAEYSIESVLTEWRSNSMGLVLDGIAPDPEPVGTVTVRHRIYEARVVVYMEGPSVAPPCRLFPRSDGLGVGGGRHYPPAKSQQRSGRRFGYY